MPAAGLPERVTIYEVGPRDGLQNEQALVPTDVKAEFIRRLVAAGLPVVEATSFVHPKWVPQLADAAELMDAARRRPGRELPVLVPNERGLDRALELGCRHIAIFGCATETFAQRNLNRSLDEQFAMFEPTVRRARDAGLDVRAYVSMCFGDPWEGDVPVDQVVDGRQAALRPRRQPAQPRRHHRRRHRRPRRARCSRRSSTPAWPIDQLAMHFHDTYGQALANAHAALQRGHHHVRRQRRRPRRLPVRRRAPPATSPPRTWSGCCTASASRPASTSSRSSRPASGWPGSSGRPSPSAVVRALA